MDVFAKIRETLNYGSVYVNMGRHYYVRDVFDRAIESMSRRLELCLPIERPTLFAT